MKTKKQLTDFEHKGNEKHSFKLRPTLLSLCMLTFIGGYSQTGQVNLNLKNATVKELFREIEKQTSYRFSYRDIEINNKGGITISGQGKELKEVLTNELAKQELYYTVSGNKIIVSAIIKDNRNNKTIIKGKIIDSKGSAIIGATIKESDTSNGTITDFEGNFSLNVSVNSTIEISYIGYKSQRLQANSIKNTVITLSEENQALDEVVVVGYTTRTREKLISSVSTINNKELVKSTVPNLENALSGRVSGVFSRQSTGEPGADGANLQIRGFGEALVVVDGIPGRSYTDIDPSEIESISVLKDASASAVYGMKGANGVILVTTKRGKKNQNASIEVSTRYGIQTPTNYPESASTELWQTLVNEYYGNLKLINDRNAVMTEDEILNRDYQYNTNWKKEMMDNAPISQSNINISGGTDKLNYFVSAGFLYQGGIWSTNSTARNRVNFRSNIDADLFQNLKLSVGVAAIINSKHYPGYGSAQIAREIKTISPNIPVRWPGHEDYYAYNGEGTINPMALADDNTSGYSRNNSKDLNVDVSLEYKVPWVEGLSLKANLGYTQNDSWDKNWNMNIVYLGYKEDANEYYESSAASNTNKASLSLTDNTGYNITGQGFINYINSFGGHNINSGLVFEFSDEQKHSFNTSRGEFPSTVLDMMAGGISNKQISNGETLRKYRTASFIGRFSYDYMSRYFVDFNFRYDGAQFFADKWGFFPSASIGWMVTNEDFMSSLKKHINELKIRASWGEMGDLSSASSYYAYNEQYYFQSGYKYPGEPMNFGDRTIYGLTPTINANPQFTWAKSSMLNIGVDFKLWKGLLSGSVDYFFRKRSDLPAQKANDNAGALKTWYNLNHDNTRGFELSLNHEYQVGDWKYNIGGNMSWSRSKNGHLEHGTFTNGYGEWKWNSEYHWTNVRWGHNCIGRYESYEDIDNAPMHENSNYNSVILPGDLKYEDWNGDGYIDDNDQRPIGRNAYPEIMYGINMGVSWKGLDFAMFWQGGGRSNFQISAFDMDAFQEGRTFQNTWAYFEDRWHKEDYTDPNSQWIPGHFPAIRDFSTTTINRETSNFWMWNGNYIRLKNIEIGYTFPYSIVNKIGIKQLRIYANAYNCLTFSAQKFFDPEQAESQFSFAAYPQIMSFNFGLNLKF